VVSGRAEFGTGLNQPDQLWRYQFSCGVRGVCQGRARNESWSLWLRGGRSYAFKCDAYGC